MKNSQIVDGAANGTSSTFQTAEEEFAVILPDARDLKVADDLVEQVGKDESSRVLTPLWNRPNGVIRCDPPK